MPIRLLKRFPRFTTPTKMKIANCWTPLADLTDLLLMGQLRRDHFCGGVRELDASSSGTFRLPGALPITIDNSNNQLSNYSDGTSTLYVRFRFFLYVSRAGITITPALYNLTTAAAVTITGASACSATDETFAGTAQQQTITFTLPAAKCAYLPQVAIGGSPAAGDTAFAACFFDCYVE